MRRTRMLVIEAAGSTPAVDLADADDWRVLVTLEGRPCAFVALPNPGRTSRNGITAATLLQHAERRVAEQRLRAELRRRLGAPEPTRTELTCSIVVCTHRRRHLLRGLLDSVQRLDPAPDEVIVVDNDPGPDDCRGEAERAGARYVREDRRGLNNARWAGVRAARGDLVAFTDDDCLVQPGWLRSLPECFADPMVAAVTGPGFPHELETKAQQLREEVASYLQGLESRTFDWTGIRVVKTGRVGTGANMILRRAALADVGELFPPELDVGTLTRSGGDLYALSRILAAGYRVAYDPGTYFLHRHTRNGDSVERTVESWGTGISAFLTRALIRDRELGAIAGWRWLWQAYVRSVLNGVEGHGDPMQVRLRWLYLRAAMAGPLAWARALREAKREEASAGLAEVRDRALPSIGGAAAPAPTAAAVPSPAREGSQGSAIALSVVLSTCSDPRRVLSRLDALAGEQPIDSGWELVVVSPASAEGLPDSVGSGTPIRWVRGPRVSPAAANAGAAAARGELLLFLDDELVLNPGLLAAHLRRHRNDEGERAVLGYSPGRPRERGLAALAARLRSEDDFRLTREASARTFVEVPVANLSVPRAAFERIGGFDARLGPARAGREWGLRALEGGLEVAYEPTAAAPRELSMTTSRYVEDAVAEGRGEALLLEAHPGAAPYLPGRPVAPTVESVGLAPTNATLERRTTPTRAGRLFSQAAISALRKPRARRAAISLLDGLEALRLRRSWLRLATLARRGAYEQGFLSVSRRHPPSARGDRAQVIELDSPEPIRPPAVGAPCLVELRLRGRALVRVSPPGGRWHPGLFEEALRRLDREGLSELGANGGSTPAVQDLSKAAVVFGPRRGRGDERHRRALEVAGASVIVVDDGRGERDHWLAVDRAIRESPAEIFGIPLPGVSPAPAWLGNVVPGLEGSRVAAVIGVGLAPEQGPSPLRLFSRPIPELPYHHEGRPSQFIAIRRDRYEEVGGFDPGAALAGPQGPVLDFVERALDAGLVIGYRETPGLAPPGASGKTASQGQWLRWQARGGLLLRHAGAIGGLRGALWFASRGLLPRARDLYRALTTRERSLLNWAGSTAAFLTGSLLAVRDRIR